MSYTIDVYRKDAPVQRNMVDFGAFVTMFPQLIAGPIVQYKTVAADLRHRLHTSENFALGARRFCVGLAKKVLLANSIGALWEDCLAAQGAGTLTVLGGWLGLAAYGFQIYFDFSGYSDMAIGLGRIFGFRFNENFDHPYCADSVRHLLAAVAHVPDLLVPGLFVYPPGRQPGRHRQDHPEPPDRLVLHGLLARGQLEFHPVGTVLRRLADLGAVRPSGRTGEDPGDASSTSTPSSWCSWAGASLPWWTWACAGTTLPPVSAVRRSGAGRTCFRLRSYAVTLAVLVLASTALGQRLWAKLPRQAEQLATPVLMGLSLVVCTAYLVDGSYNPFLYFRF